MEKIRFGLVGVGIEGSAYASFLTGDGVDGCEKEKIRAKRCELGALCDIDPERKKFCEEKYPDVPFFTDYRDLINSGKVDAIITTVPHYLHHEVGIYALEHGVHVLGEKPAGVRAKDVQALIDCSKKHPELTFGIMFNQRTNPLYRKIKEIVETGELGELRRSNWIINTWWRPDQYYKLSDWRATWGGEGGGVLVNQAPHQLDLWQWICGIPTQVYAECIFGAHRDIVVENDVTAVTRYANGATGCFITCTHDLVGTDRFEIDFSKGKIVVENSKHATIYKMVESEPEFSARLSFGEQDRMKKEELYSTEEYELTNTWGYQHCLVMDDFASHILDGTPLLAPGEDGINGVRLANSMLLSSWLGKPVENPCDEKTFNEELNKRILDEGKFPVRED